MTEAEKALLEIPAKSVGTILDVLLDIRHRQTKGEDLQVPLATFQLSNGRDVRGWVLDKATEHGADALLVHDPGTDPRSADVDVIYLDPRSIVAITVHGAGHQAHLFSFGSLNAAPGTPAPGKLEVRRKLEEFSRGLSETVGAAVAFEVAWEGVPQGGEPLRSLAELATVTWAVLHEAAADAVGKEAIARAIRQVRFTHAAEPGSRLAGGVLTVHAALDRGPNGRLSKSALAEAVNQAL